MATEALPCGSQDERQDELKEEMSADLHVSIIYRWSPDWASRPTTRVLFEQQWNDPLSISSKLFTAINKQYVDNSLHLYKTIVSHCYKTLLRQTEDTLIPTKSNSELEPVYVRDLKRLEGNRWLNDVVTNFSPLSKPSHTKQCDTNCTLFLHR